jgi:hypothetical protein
MVCLIADLIQDWRRLDERIEVASTEIEVMAQQDAASAVMMPPQTRAFSTSFENCEKFACSPPARRMS